MLIKKSFVKNQAKLNQKQRLKNIIGSFEINLNEQDNIKGKNILIVDDVFTTGATLDECSKILKLAKSNKIYTCTFTKTKFINDCN